MTRSCVGRGPASRVGPLAVVALFVLGAASCTGVSGSQQVVTPPAEAFVTDNALLYPPELWSAVGPSTLARLTRHVALAAVGEDVSWDVPPDAALAAIAEETTPVLAAYVMLWSGVLGDGPRPWTVQDVESWWASAVSGGSIEDAWMARQLAADLTMDLALTDAERRTLGKQAGDDLLSATNLTELLASESGADHRAPVVVGGEDDDPGLAAATTLGATSDAAALVLRSAEAGQRLADLDPTLIERARTAAATDDLAWARLVRAYVAAGERDEARRLFDTFDLGRLRPDGTVMERPSFQGTVGSSFRMVRYFNQAGGVSRWLSPEASAELAVATTAVIDTDSSHRVAGAALLRLLDAESPVGGERAVQEFLDDAGVGDDPMVLEQAAAWAAAAEYADILGVAITFPGLADAAVDRLLVEERQTVLPLLARIAAAAGSATATSRPIDPRLVDLIVDEFQNTDIDDIPSSELFVGAYALVALGETLPFSAEALRAEANARRGACLGGFDGFLRESRSEGVVCDVNSSYFAELILGRVGQ